MTKEELIDRINDIEWEDFEAKEAKSELPKNIWETVSAFANTSGGWIVLGVKQNGKKFEISGVDNAEKLEQDFLGTLRSQKFNEPVDTSVRDKKKCLKKLVISDIFCIFVVEIQLVTNIKRYHYGDYQGQSYRIILYY